MREGAVNRPIASQTAIALVLVASAGACTNSAGGLLVELSVEPSLESDHLTQLSVDIGSIDGGTNYADGSYVIEDASDGATTPGYASFPTSIGIDSNGDPDAAIAIGLSVSNRTGLIESQHYRVVGVPASRVAVLPVVFGSACGARGPMDRGPTSCPLERWCTWSAPIWTCYGNDLPGLDPDASISFAGVEDAGLDATLDTMTDAARSDAPVKDSTVGDAVRADAYTDTPLNIPCDAPCGAGYQCVEGVCVAEPPSCSGGGAGAGPNCGGSNGTDDCCASDEVLGGSFYRDYDHYGFQSNEYYPASVSQFRLDRYEVTVGRFRAFVNATSAGDAAAAWTPPQGSGRQTYLNDGAGLSSGGDAGSSYEPGWQSTWNNFLPQTPSQWLTQFDQCDDEDAGFPTGPTWTEAVGPNENRPINCVNWFEAYAFCIWDGGFLPSFAEWDYTAAGGGENQYVYAWGDTDPASSTNYAVYACYYGTGPLGSDCKGVANIAPVGSAYMGGGAWGQLDLTGNVFEYVLDYGPTIFPSPCIDCAAISTSSESQHYILGGGWASPVTQLPNSVKTVTPPEYLHGDVGMRCARAPTP
jgi:sulfatase modifying factor 1